MDRKWWKEAVVYQLYPRSFYDSDGDGIGDLQGIIQKVDYLCELGIDAVWLNPIYKSPNDDMGYDISDYQDIMTEFGTLDDFKELAEKLKENNIKLIMDMVVNHSSDEHEWFVESKKSRENDKRDYYIWVDGEKGTPPNNWASFFTPSAWKYDEQSNQYYLHLFSEKQPDLNWNNPKLRQEIYDMMKWWADLGVDGFRMDVINLLDKAEGFPSSEKQANMSGYVMDDELFANRENVHTWLKEMRKEVFTSDELVMIGETPFVTVEMAQKYADPKVKEMDMLFAFDLMDVNSGKSGKWEIIPFSIPRMKEILNDWQIGLANCWNSLFWSNHDQPRAVSRFGNDSKEYREKSAKMLGTLMHMLKGTPYIYQGEEIGMTNMIFESLDDLRDLESINYYSEAMKAGLSHAHAWDCILQKGRDNARTPMQWDTSESAGFTSGKPWQKVNPNYSNINVEESIKREDSVFSYYKLLIKTRKENDIVVYGEYSPLFYEHDKIVAFERILDDEKWVIIVNFVDEKVKVEFDYFNSELIISNTDSVSIKDKILSLNAYDAYVFRVK